MFSVGWDFYRDGAKEDWAKVIGQIIKPRTLKIVGTGKSFGIWFYPHTFSWFSKIQLVELNDLAVPWGVLFPETFAEFVGNCLQDREINKLIDGTNKFLLERLTANQTKRIDILAEAAIHYLYQHRTNSDLDRLASTLNVSHRHLQKTFLSKVGLSQKQFIRMLRFQQTLQMMAQACGLNFTSLAYENNYYDQSHLVKEFKAFTGFSPSDFASEKFPINKHFILSA